MLAIYLRIRNRARCPLGAYKLRAKRCANCCGHPIAGLPDHLRLDRPDGIGAQRRPPGGHRASRYQARELHGTSRRLCEGAGLRAGEDAGAVGPRARATASGSNCGNLSASGSTSARDRRIRRMPRSRCHYGCGRMWRDTTTRACGGFTTTAPAWALAVTEPGLQRRSQQARSRPPPAEALGRAGVRSSGK